MVMSINLNNLFSNFFAVKRQGRKEFHSCIFVLTMNVNIEGMNGFEVLEKLNLVDAPLRTEVFRAKDKRSGYEKANNIKMHTTNKIFSREKELEKKKIYYYTRLKRQRRDFHEQIYKGQCC